MLLSKIDGMGKGAWFALLLATFWMAWPLGLALVGVLAATGRLQAWRAEMRSFGGGWAMPQGGRWSWPGFAAASSGNNAFDSYRDETLRRLEEERVEFQAFLERLRQARDKAEFDAFMAERRHRPSSPEAPRPHDMQPGQ